MSFVNRRPSRHKVSQRKSHVSRSVSAVARAILLLAATGIAVVPAQTFPVVQKRAFWPDAQGELVISEQSIEFRAAKEKASREWSYIDIQHLDRVSPKELRILTYEDRKWRLGEDREFRFLITEGEIGDALFEELQTRLNLPTTDRVAREPASPLHQIPVKHLHTFGGCEGTLSFTEESVVYRTAHEKDARAWRLGVDVESVWSPNPYRLEVHAYEQNRWDFVGTSVYRFTLKKPLDPEFYRELKLRLHGLEWKDNSL